MFTTRRCWLQKRVRTFLAVVVLFFTSSLAYKSSLDHALLSGRVPKIDTSYRKKLDLPGVPPPSLYLHASEDQRLLLISGYAETSFTFTFTPEEGLNYSDYQLSHTCSNSDTLQEEDVDLSPPIVEGKSINITAVIEFQRSVGDTEYTITFHRLDGSFYASKTIRFLIAGVSFYRIDPITKKKFLLIGNTHRILSYKDVLAENMYTYYVFVQYLDGSTREENIRNSAKLKDIKTLIEGAPLIAAHNLESCTYGHALYNGDGLVQLENNCSFGFAVTPTEVFFGVKLVKYRSGMIVFRFVWSTFTIGFDDFEEEYETRLTIMVGGTPPPAVVSIAPQGPFSRSGGQFLKCVVINLGLVHAKKYIFTVTGVESKIDDFVIVGSPKYISAGDYYVLTFKTSPGSGTGLGWKLDLISDASTTTTALYAGEKEFLFNYVSQDSVIKSLSPSHGPVQGGIFITCTGAFDEFVASRDAIFIGGYKIGESDIVSISGTEIVFKLPSKTNLPASEYEVEVYIIFSGIKTDSTTFYYESLEEVFISMVGGSFDFERGVYQVPRCNDGQESLGTLLAEVNDGAALASLQYHWTVVTLPSKENVLAIKNSTSLTIDIPRDLFNTGVLYECVITVTDPRYGTQKSTSTGFEVLDGGKYGVSLLAPRTRSISTPPTAMRIASFVTSTGNCGSGGATRRLVYEWSYKGVVTKFSYDSHADEFGSASPTRFGREFMIPQEQLTYGTFTISLKALSAENPDLFGMGILKFSVVPAPLRAVIGSGESFVTASSASDLRMSAAKSFDPDLAVIDRSRSSEGIEYHWECVISTSGGSEFTAQDVCPDWYLPKKDVRDFDIAQSELTTGSNESLFLKYSLTVSKDYGVELGRRLSPSVSQMVEVTQGQAQLKSTQSVSIMTSTGEEVDPHNVKYYETLIITPKAEEGVEWRFKLLEPQEQSFTFLNNPDNLIIYPGYFRPGSLVTGRVSLAIRAYALAPGTEYKFLIQYESQEEGLANEVEVILQTIEKPELEFLPLDISNGTTETPFTAYAMPSYYGGEFKFYFYLKFADGTELCIDGCSGNQIVMFRVPVAGTYTIRSAMYDARGKSLLAKAAHEHTITVTEVESSVEPEIESNAIAESLNKMYYEGDHGGFGVASLAVADLFMTQESVTSDEVGIETIWRLWRLAENSRPNTPLGKDYLSIALHFALHPLGSTLLNDPESFLCLIKILELAIVNTPEEEKYDLIDELILTETRLSAHAEQFKWGGTSRRRLLSVTEEGYNYLLVDFSEKFLPLITRVTARDETCGYYEKKVLENFANVSIGIFCNAEQGNYLQGEFSQFKWCNKVFSENGDERRVFVMAEVRDYVDESNVGQIQNVNTHSNVLTKVSILRYDSNHPAQFVRADEDLDTKDCYQITQTLKQMTRAFGGEREMNCGSATTFKYLNPKSFNQTLNNQAYTQRILPSTFDKQTSKVSSLVSRIGGTYGGFFEQCRTIQATLIGTNGGLLAGITIGVIIIIFAISLTLWLALSTAVKVTTLHVTREDEESFVNRDPFGRGEPYNNSAPPIDQSEDDNSDVDAFENDRNWPIDGENARGGEEDMTENDEF